MNRTTYGVAVAGLAIGLMAGGSFVYKIVPPEEPRACASAREMATDVMLAQSDMTSAIQVRGDALEQVAYHKADLRVRAEAGKLAPLVTEYDALRAECEAS